MRLLTRMLRQDAVWWAQSQDSDGRPVHDEHGQLLYDDPVAVRVRWEDIREEYIASNGSKEISRSKIFVAVDMKPGDYLMLGELDSSIAEDPRDEEQAFDIKSWNKVPTLSGRRYARIVYL